MGCIAYSDELSKEKSSTSLETLKFRHECYTSPFEELLDELSLAGQVVKLNAFADSKR